MSSDALIPIITGFVSILLAIGAAVAWITRKITRLEDRIDGLEKKSLVRGV
jgi:hypothetical protein